MVAHFWNCFSIHMRGSIDGTWWTFLLWCYWPRNWLQYWVQNLQARNWRWVTACIFTIDYDDKIKQSAKVITKGRKSNLKNSCGVCCSDYIDCKHHHNIWNFGPLHFIKLCCRQRVKNERFVKNNEYVANLILNELSHCLRELHSNPGYNNCNDVL